MGAAPRLAARWEATVDRPDPNETLRMPTPQEGGTPPTEGWPGSTLEPDVVPEAPAPHAPAPDPSPSSDPPPPAAAPAEPEAAWSPPPVAAAPRRREPDPGRAASVVFGLIMLAIGLWFFAEQTLGLELPRIRWSSFWPVILIGFGVWIVLGSMRRDSR
jgi:hypothetical protein